MIVNYDNNDREYNERGNKYFNKEDNPAQFVLILTGLVVTCTCNHLPVCSSSK